MKFSVEILARSITIEPVHSSFMENSGPNQGRYVSYSRMAFFVEATFGVDAISKVTREWPHNPYRCDIVEIHIKEVK